MTKLSSRMQRKEILHRIDLALLVLQSLEQSVIYNNHPPCVARRFDLFHYVNLHLETAQSLLGKRGCK